MLAVLLEFDVKPGYEQDFLKYWKQTTQIISAKHGGLGSKLHISNTGSYIAYAQWPSKGVYESEQSWSEEDLEIRSKMRNTLKDEKVKVLHTLSVISDLTL